MIPEKHAPALRTALWRIASAGANMRSDVEPAIKAATERVALIAMHAQTQSQETTVGLIFDELVKAGIIRSDDAAVRPGGVAYLVEAIQRALEAREARYATALLQAEYGSSGTECPCCASLRGLHAKNCALDAALTAVGFSDSASRAAARGSPPPAPAETIRHNHFGEVFCPTTCPACAAAALRIVG